MFGPNSIMNSQISQMQMGQMNPMQMPMNMNMNMIMHFPNNQMPNQMFMQTQPSMNTGNETMNRISQEYNFCVNDNDLVAIGCNFGLENNNIFTWRITMSGPTNTPYGGGLFTILATFPNDYPVHGPEFKFKNKIFHLNVNFSDDPGHICISSLNDWRIRGKVKDLPFYTVKQALFDIFCLFYNQGVEGAYDDQMAYLYQNQPQKFNEEAKKWTKEFASII